MAEKKSKHDEYLDVVKAQSWCPYVDTTIKVVGVYSTTEDMLLANKSKNLKALKNKFNYTIQMVIK